GGANAGTPAFGSGAVRFAAHAGRDSARGRTTGRRAGASSAAGQHAEELIAQDDRLVVLLVLRAVHQGERSLARGVEHLPQPRALRRGGEFLPVALAKRLPATR